MNDVFVMARQRWIPSLFVFGFLVVIAVNAVLIMKATETFSGLVVEHPYKKGAEYSRMQKLLTAQKDLHWSYRMTAVVQQDGRFRLTMELIDESGAALQDLEVGVELSRPVENLPVMKAAMANQGGGRYEALLALPRSGLWDLRLNAMRGGTTFIAVERLLVPQ